MGESVWKLTRNGWSSLAMDKNAASFAGSSASLISWQTVLYDLEVGSWIRIFLSSNCSHILDSSRQKTYASFANNNILHPTVVAEFQRHYSSAGLFDKILASRWTIYTIAACFPFEPLQKCMTFKDILSGLSRILSFNSKDFPGPKWFSRTFQVLEFSRKKTRTFQEAWEPCYPVTEWPLPYLPPLPTDLNDIYRH